MAEAIGERKEMALQSAVNTLEVYFIYSRSPH